MVDEKIKKILIFAMPRTGTTVIQNIIAYRLFGIPNLVEPFNDPKLGFEYDRDPADLYKWVSGQSTGVIKLLGINLNYVNVDKLLSVANFDRVVIVERKNLTDCCVSLCLAYLTSKYHYYRDKPVDIEPFECDSKFVDYWIRMYRQYVIELTKIKNSGVPYDTICYEDFISDQIQYIANVPLQQENYIPSQVSTVLDETVSLELPYQDLCINYYEVKEKIRNNLC